MGRIYETAYVGDAIVSFTDATLSIASSAVMYGLSIYTVFPIHIAHDGKRFAFRLHDHYQRLIRSSRLIGIDTFEHAWTEERFMQAVRELVVANDVSEDVFVRVTVHVDELLAGVRSRGLTTKLSMFVYQALPILPPAGSRVKTTAWRRVSDTAIPPRAKVNGAYVNSVLGKQEALDCGYDDCLFLDAAGHVCELSAANIFFVRDSTLITPAVSGDLLEGISRATILMLARELGIATVQRAVDLTELYGADEAFASGTSAYISPILEIDARPIGSQQIGAMTTQLQEQYLSVLRGKDPRHVNLLTAL